jgi:superfamily II DNA/RNA helicase
LSEGQNLQDADLVVNYDIHWNPVRLIQRFGRIDRIGSENQYIGSVNFWPATDYDEVLNLARRLNDRMVAMAIVGAETLDVNQKVKDMMSDNPLIDENTQKLLEQMKNNISDIEQPQTVTLADLSLETFRQDLMEFLNSHKDYFLSMPNGAFSGFKVDPTLFKDFPESLVALVGYPHRSPNVKDKRYENLYLVLHPVDKSSKTTIEEINVAETMDFLRRHKRQETFLPECIATPNKERVDKLSAILKDWMQARMVKEGNALVLNPLDFIKSNPTMSLDEKFKFENFDLIVWEYVSKD